MSDNKHFCEFEITQKGHNLRQKAVAEGYKIDFTRGALGQGRPEDGTDLYFMTELVEHAVDVPIKESYAVEQNHIMVIVIDGVKLQEDIMMTEMAIYARLIDPETKMEAMPEVLYGYTFTYKYDYIPAGESYNLYREIGFDTILSRNGKLEITYDKTKVYVTRNEFENYGAQNMTYDNTESGMSATKIQGAIDELKSLFDNKIIVSPVQPENQPIGGIWIDTSDGPLNTEGEAVIVVANAVVSETEPAGNHELWFHLDGNSEN